MLWLSSVVSERAGADHGLGVVFVLYHLSEHYAVIANCKQAVQQPTIGLTAVSTRRGRQSRWQMEHDVGQQYAARVCVCDV